MARHSLRVSCGLRVGFYSLQVSILHTATIFKVNTVRCLHIFGRPHSRIFLPHYLPRMLRKIGFGDPHRLYFKL